MRGSSPETPDDGAAMARLVQQAQAAAANESMASIVESDPISDAEAPPPYGESYGEITTEKDGLGTIAQVTDDGRVNIRINQLNRRLSQAFATPFREHIQDAQAPKPLPLTINAPALNIVIQVVGSRGDVQPFIAIGKALARYGHRVRLATHPVFKDFVGQHGLEFFSIGGDPSTLMAFMAKNPGLVPGFRSIVSGDVGRRRKVVAEYIQGCWRSCYEAVDNKSFVADCIIANPPSFAHVHCAEKLGVPLHIMSTMPYSPTQAFAHPLANIQSSNADPQLNNYISYAMIEMLSWQGFGEIINRFRAKCLRLEPVSRIWAPGMLQRLKVPHTYCWSPALLAKPPDWASHITVSGFSFLDLAKEYIPPSDLQAFIGVESPVYIGFGSIVLDDPDVMTQLIFTVARKTSRRILLSKEWGGIGRELTVPENVFMLGNVPHDWLFPLVSCVVHHGGAGTTAAGIAAGKPTVIVPFFGDQHFWGSIVSRAGAGPAPIPHKQLTADKLTDAIEFCFKPETLQRAKELADKVATENGSEKCAQAFHQQLEVDKLRCTLLPSRQAVWRIKRTQIRLSALAACTLANANLLDFSDLKLFRYQEYETDKGPWDPISGGFVALAAAAGGMTRGLLDFPTETYKAVSMSFKSQDSSAQEQNDMLRTSGAHTSKGARKFTRALVEAPMDVSMSFTKGLYNLPRLWGDDQVRSHDKVDDFASGAKAAGKGFGLAFYDGISGLVVQPVNGARKEGATGFFKGIGKGVGGFVAKSSAGTLGVPSYMMKGVQKELQRRFGANVQSYIAATRTAQGYDEWLKSSEAEREQIIERWGLIQRYVKGKYKQDDMMRDVLRAHERSTVPSVTDSLEADDVALALNSEYAPADSVVPDSKDASQGSFPIGSNEDGDLYRVSTEQATERTMSDAHPNPSDHHLAGTTQREFEAQKPTEKTAEEKTEESIVLEYIKKQSLLEQQHKGKRVDTDDEDLQRALKLSLNDANSE